ncbi:MAG: DUF4276 family protein [bacterium]|nr:DUF4276 family protein [bacterium]
MKRNVEIFIEGGGEGKTRHNLRLGFSEFIGGFSTLSGRSDKPRINCCGSRDKAFEKFYDEVIKNPSQISLLLVDSEGPVTQSPVDHLRSRDNWDFSGIDPDHVHLMVQAMEAWFMTDKDALKEYFKQGFKENALPRRPDVEEIPKDDLKASLNNAASSTTKGEYREIRDGSEILKLINRDKIKTTKHGKFFFDKLEEIFSSL